MKNYINTPESDVIGYLKTAQIEWRRHHVQRALTELIWAIREACWSVTH
jgi:hypothetical protein